jgi:protein-tyrosine-phosphatase
MTTILIVGGADTGRAPMAVALLRRRLKQRGRVWNVSSAGVLGHDDDSPEIEARDTMAHMGLDISNHRARSITDELVAEAALLLAIDSGTALVLRARFPDATARIHSLGELAKRKRDIPDPFRMQMGAWMTYARELDTLLESSLLRLDELLPDEAAQSTLDNQPAPNEQVGIPEAVPAERIAAIDRCERLLQLLVDMPVVVHWPAARAQLGADLDVSASPANNLDLSAALGGLLRVILMQTAASPSPGQLTVLREAFTRLRQPITQDDVTWLSLQIGGWANL